MTADKLPRDWVPVQESPFYFEHAATIVPAIDHRIGLALGPGFGGARVKGYSAAADLSPSP